MKRHGKLNVLFGCAALFIQAALARAGDDPKGTEPLRRDHGIVRTDRSPHANLRSVNLADVRWTEGFWADQFQKAREVTLPRLWDLAGPWAWHNMQVAAELKQGEVKGCFWEDAWLYKWIESAAYLYSQTRDPALLDQMDRIIAVIAKAQQPDGYLATQVTLRDRERFAVNAHHELYTMGHLLTAACAHYRITGTTNLLDVAKRVADYLHSAYQDGDPKMINCPLNPSIIMGAVELYRTTGNKKYLELANIVIDNRGKKRGKISRTPWGRPLGGTDLNQDRRPLREETEVVGHAVFFTYLYAGAADTYLETGDQSLWTALDRLWHDLTQRKMYITGGVSPVHRGLSSHRSGPGKRTILDDRVHEAAGLPYDLPNATSYNETCGQIGNMMWNWRMLLATGDARFADIMERNIYNSILSGVNVSGHGWSYTNPLRWYGPEHELLNNDYHERIDPGERQICCPTNLLRTVASMHGYLYTTGNDGLWVHHYGANKLTTQLPDGRHLQLTQTTDYPWQGDIELTIDSVEPGKPFAIMLRIPGWAKGAAVTVNGERVPLAIKPASYAKVQRGWQSGDKLQLSLPMPVRMMIADSRLEQTRNQVAVMRGPIVYCLESIDLPNGVAIERVHVPRAAEWIERHDPDLLGGVTVLGTEGVAWDVSSDNKQTYRELRGAPAPRKVAFRLIPYFAWNNRGEPEMTVWLPLWNH